MDCLGIHVYKYLYEFVHAYIHSLTQQFVDVNAVLQEYNRRLVQHREGRYHKSREASETFKDGSGTWKEDKALAQIGCMNSTPL